MDLPGSLNGHGVSFRPGVSVGSINIDDFEPFTSRVIQVTPAPSRQKLPPRRGGFTQILRMSDGMKLYLRTGEYSDGTLGEIFIDTQKFGTFARSMLNCFAMAISTGLQHGVPLQVFVDHFKGTQFEPQGEVYGSDFVSEATSIIDAIFKELEQAYPEGKAVKPSIPRPPISI
jgi:ribonucleoside-diphosphate reductase alpha chain